MLIEKNPFSISKKYLCVLAYKNCNLPYLNNANLDWAYQAQSNQLSIKIWNLSNTSSNILHLQILFTTNCRIPDLKNAILDWLSQAQGVHLSIKIWKNPQISLQIIFPSLTLKKTARFFSETVLSNWAYQALSIELSIKICKTSQFFFKSFF